MMFESNRSKNASSSSWLRHDAWMISLLVLLVLPACDRKHDNQEQNTSVSAPDAATNLQGSDASADEVASTRDGASLDALLLSSKQDPSLNRSLRDFQRHARQLMLFAPDDVLDKGERAIPDARLRRPIVQSSMLKTMLEQVMIERAAKARQIEVNFQEIEQRIANDPALARFASSLPPSLDGEDSGEKKPSEKARKLEELDLAVTDLHEVARHQLLREKLEAALANEVDKEQVERSYRQAHDRVKMLWIRISNTPRTTEIDAFLEGDANLASIQDHYAQHPQDFRSPAIAVADLLVIPAASRLRDRERVDLLKKAREDLAGGLSFEEVAARHELTPRPSQSIVLKEDGRIHGAAIGETGVSIQAPRGDYVWIVREKIPSKQLELDRPLKREIAATLMRRRGQVKSANAAAMTARDVLSKLPKARLSSSDLDALAKEVEVEVEDRLAANRVRLNAVAGDWIERHPDGFLVKIGTSPDLMRAIFELKTRGETLKEPVTIDQHLWIGVLADREEPDLEAFSKDYETFRAQYLDAMRGHLLDTMFPRWQDELGIVLDRAPLTAYYGREEKKR